MNYNNTSFYAQGGYPQQPEQQQPVYQPLRPMMPSASPAQTNNPDSNLKSGGFKFTVYKDEERPHRAGDLVVDRDGEPIEQKRRRGRPRKSEQVINSNEIIRGDEDPNAPVPTAYTYQETTNMLRGTLAQIDQLAAQVKNELDNVTASRTLKSKYNVMVGLSGNLGDILGQKISVIKEINNSISKSNDMDYKREKDRKAAEGVQNDDKYLMDMYNAMIQNPNMVSMQQPSGINATLMNNQIVRADANPQQVQQGGIADAGYLGYISNLTPEQRLMSVEDNPDIKQCVVMDMATGGKSFVWMNLATGQAIPDLPTRDQMFMSDVTINLKDRIAKNLNLSESYPLIVINEDVANNY